MTEEQQRRSFMLSELRGSGPGPYSPAVIRDLRIYGGAAGIWVDRATTADTTRDPIGATASVNHTGMHYPDDLSDTGLIYHYTVNKRPGVAGSNEIVTSHAATVVFRRALQRARKVLIGE